MGGGVPFILPPHHCDYILPQMMGEVGICVSLYHWKAAYLELPLLGSDDSGGDFYTTTPG